MGSRVTQVVLEVLSSDDAAARVTQAALEALSTNDAAARVTQAVLEVLTVPDVPVLARRHALGGDLAHHTATQPGGRAWRRRVPSTGADEPSIPEGQSPEVCRTPRHRRSRKQFHHQLPPWCEEINNVWAVKRRVARSPGCEAAWRGGIRRVFPPPPDAEFYWARRRWAKCPQPEPPRGRVVRWFSIEPEPPALQLGSRMARSPQPEPARGMVTRRPVPAAEFDLFRRQDERWGKCPEPPPFAGTVRRGRVPGQGESDLAVAPARRVASVLPPPAAVLEGDVWRGKLWNTGESAAEGQPFVIRDQRRRRADESCAKPRRPDRDDCERRERKDETE